MRYNFFKIGIPKNISTGKDLEKTFKALNKPLFGYVFIRLQNRELAEDLTQEVFVKAWRFRETFDETKSSLKNWIFVIATNLLRDHYKKKKIELEEMHENIAEKGDLAEDVKKDDLIAFVFKKIIHLPERDQELITLRYKSDLTIEEVAEVMEMEYSATKVAIHRAIKKLQSFCND